MSAPSATIESPPSTADDRYEQLVREILWAKAAVHAAPTRAIRRQRKRELARLERRRIRMQMCAYAGEPLLAEAAVALRRTLPRAPRRVVATSARVRGCASRPRPRQRRQRHIARRTSSADPGDGDPEPPGPLGASREVIREHLERHRACCGDHAGSVVPCPCRRTLAVTCNACGLPIFLAFEPDRPICVHGLELLEVAP